MINIKGLGINNITPIEARVKTEAKESIKAGASDDRDADGRRQPNDQNQEETLTEQHIEKAIEFLKKHPGVKEHSLRIERVIQNEKVTLLIKDYSGNVIRRVAHSQIVELSRHEEGGPATGQLYNKAM